MEHAGEELLEREGCISERSQEWRQLKIDGLDPDDARYVEDHIRLAVNLRETESWWKVAIESSAIQVVYPGGDSRAGTFPWAGIAHQLLHLSSTTHLAFDNRCLQGLLVLVAYRGTTKLQRASRQLRVWSLLTISADLIRRIEISFKIPLFGFCLRTLTSSLNWERSSEVPLHTEGEETAQLKISFVFYRDVRRYLDCQIACLVLNT